MIRNNYKKAEKKFLIFPNMKSIDQMLCLSLCLSLFYFVATLGQTSLLGWFIFGIVLCFIMSLSNRLFYGKNHLQKYESEAAVVFNGSIAELTLALYDNDCRLKNKIGEFYIFYSKFVILPKCEVVVSVHGGKCFLHTSKSKLNRLGRVVNFESLPNTINKDGSSNDN
jgi:hypothetical protein